MRGDRPLLLKPLTYARSHVCSANPQRVLGPSREMIMPVLLIDHDIRKDIIGPLPLLLAAIRGEIVWENGGGDD